MKCIILLVLKKKKNKKSKDKCWIRDELATTKFGDPNEAFKVYMQKRPTVGNDISWKRGIIFEHFKGMKMKKIADKIEGEVKRMGENSDTEVKITREETEI